MIELFNPIKRRGKKERAKEEEMTWPGGAVMTAQDVSIAKIALSLKNQSDPTVG